MNIRRLSIAVSALCLFALPASADEFSDNLQANLNAPALDALAQDVGAIVGAGSFHSGESLRFPVGFDVGFHFGGVDVSDDNPILRDNDSFATAGFMQLELGLPAKFNLIGRYGKLYDADVIGGGLRWGLLDSDLPLMPSIAISGLYNQLDHDDLEGRVVSANVVLSFDVPILHPYVGFGYDWTKIDPTSSAFNGAAASVDRSVEGDSEGYRAEAGINLSVLPFTYITLGGGIANGQTLGHAGLGVRF